jgi:hypothetical protein
MKFIIKITLAICGLLLLSACGSEGAPAPIATQVALVPAAGTVAPSAALSSTAPAAPVIQKRTITSRRSIPFKTLRVSDSTLSRGTTAVRNPGGRGMEILTYRVTLRNGVRIHRKLVKKVIVRAPVTRTIAVGTRETQQCDPNYSGACVPIASDVDCAGGSGNGPAYVQGPVEVIGTDIYGLDADGDGIGCEDG